MTPPSTAQDRAADMSTDGTEPGVKPRPTSRDDTRWEFYDQFIAFPLSSTHRSDASVGAEVVMGEYADEGGCVGEFVVRWYDLGDCYSPRIEAFSDAWDALASSGVVDIMRGLDPVTPSAFMQRLRDAGYYDRTNELRRHGPSYCPTCGSHEFIGARDVARQREDAEGNRSSRPRRPW